MRDRIIELRRVKSSDLRPNPRNWRGHPVAQRSALRGLLEEVGIADALIAYQSKRLNGDLVLIDGHLRQEENPDTKWPVLLLDVTDAEADKLLVSLDPLASLATTNASVLEGLLEEIETDHSGVSEFLSNIAEDAGIEPPDFEPVPFTDQSQLDHKKPIQCPECGHEFTT